MAGVRAITDKKVRRSRLEICLFGAIRRTQRLIDGHPAGDDPMILDRWRTRLGRQQAHLARVQQALS